MKERARFRGIASSRIAVVFYESPQRLRATIDDLIASGCGDRQCAIGRELTKKFEQTLRGTVAELRELVGEAVRGELVVMLAGAEAREPSPDDARELAARLRADGVSARDIVERLTAELGVPRNLAYKFAHERAGEEPALEPDETSESR